MDKEELEEEKFYERICRAYIEYYAKDNLDFVVENEENNNSIAHGYFKNKTIAKKYGYGKKVTTKNFKTAIYDGYTDDEIENEDIDYYEYDTWQDFYCEVIEDKIYDDLSCLLWEFYENENDSIFDNFYISISDLEKIKKGIKDELDYIQRRNEVCATSKADLMEEDMLVDKLNLLDEFIENADCYLPF